MANSNLVTREDLKNVFEALGEGDYGTRIDALETHDYIVEQGTSGIWTYRKWASGIAECWGTLVFACTSSSQAGSNYYSNVIQSDLPFTMSSAVVQATMSDGLAWVSNINAYPTHIAFRLMRSTKIQASDGNYTARITINGRWK